MADIERSIEIPAPPGEVFRFVASEWESTLEFWESGIEEWHPLSAGGLGEGFQVEYVGRMLGVGLKVRMEVRDFQDGRGWTAHSMGGPLVRGDWRFDSVNEGTRFTYRLRYRMPPPLIGLLLDKLLIERRWSSAIEASLGNLKANFSAR